jgi:hypothetical protein
MKRIIFIFTLILLCSFVSADQLFQSQTNVGSAAFTADNPGEGAGSKILTSSSYDITSITLNCQSLVGNPILAAEIWSHNNATNRPDSLLQRLTSKVHSSNGWVNYTADNINTTLSNNTIYWVVVMMISGDASNKCQPRGSALGELHYSQTTDSGATWGATGVFDLGYYVFGNLSIPTPPTNITDGVNLTSPTNGEIFNVENLTFRYTLTTPSVKTCMLLRDGIPRNYTYNATSGNYTIQDTTFSYPIEQTFTYQIKCVNATVDLYSQEINITIDHIQPDIEMLLYYGCVGGSYTTSDIDTPLLYSNTSFVGCGCVPRNVNYSVKIITTDPNLYAVNMTSDINWNYSFFESSISTNNKTYYVPITPQNLTSGLHWLNVEVCDGHTTQKIKNYSIKQLSKDKIKFDNTEITALDYDIQEINYTKLKDRYKFKFKYSKPKSKIRIEIPEDCEYQKDSKYTGHFICLNDKKWIDFENNKSYTVSVNKKTVTIFSILPTNEWEFESIGSLNCHSINYTIYKPVVNSTTSFPSTLLYEGGTFTFNLTMIYNESYVNGTNAFFYFNGVNQVKNLLSLTNNSGIITEIWQSTITLPFQNESEINYTYYWDALFSKCSSTGCIGCAYVLSVLVGNITLESLNIDINLCNTTINYTILNMSYYDEVTLSPISLLNAYNLTFYDGLQYINKYGSVSNTSNTFCSTLNPDNFTYNWNMFGTLQLSKTSYATRVFTIDSYSPYLVSNNPQKNISLYMISLANSTTVSYTWLTTGFSPINGIWRIYKCVNNTRVLVESTVISDGLGIANIELITQPYSYDVIIDGIVYTSNSFSTCHIEASDTRTYYVDVNALNIYESIGLYLVSCNVEKVSNNTVTMSWSQNPGDNSVITGCIVAKRQTISNITEIFRNCTTGSTGSFTNSIPSTGNNYWVEGHLIQNGNEIICKQNVAFISQKTETELLGGMAIFSSFLLIASLILIFSTTGEGMLFGGIIGVIVSWLLGITAYDWTVVSPIVAFLFIVVIITRSTRSNQ